MEIKYQKHSRRKNRSFNLWLNIGKDYNAGITAASLAKKYNRSRAHIYWVLNKLKALSNQ